MKQSPKTRTAKILGGIVLAAGLLAMAGWIFDIGPLKSISSGWVSMKFITAFSFALSGVTLYFMARAAEGETDRAQVALYLTTLPLLLIMGALFFSGLLGAHTGLEDLFVKELPGDVKTVIPGRPSLPTALNFILFAVGGLLAMHTPRVSRRWLRLPGWLVAAIGAVALAGYAADAPRLYYFVPGANSAMAFGTAVLFLLLGAGLICLSDPNS